MDKKGQVTIFIIIGIILIFAVLVYKSYGEDNKVKEVQLTPEEIFPIKSFVQSCLDKDAKEATILLALYGGKMDELVYNNILSLSEMEDELSEYINDNIDNCLNDLEVLKNDKFYFKTKEHTIETSINTKDVSFIFKYPIKIEKEGAVGDLEFFTYSYHDIEIPYLRDLALLILKDEEWLNDYKLVKQIENKNIQVKIKPSLRRILFSLVAENIKFNFGQEI